MSTLFTWITSAINALWNQMSLMKIAETSTTYFSLTALIICTIIVGILLTFFRKLVLNGK